MRERFRRSPPFVADPDAARVLDVDGLRAGHLGIPATWDVSLHVGRGEVVALLGPNGAGKTTTLSTIAGLLKPLSGSVRFLGNEIGGTAAYRLARYGMALVPEDRSLFPSLTVRESLKVVSKGAALSEKDMFDMLPELERCLNRPAGVLSGGEQQMLAVGRAVMSRPKLLLVDEMSLGLAPVIVERLLPVLRRISTELGTSVLFVEQHIASALEVADRAYVLNNGRIVLQGSAAELEASRSLLEASYLGDLDAAEADGADDARATGGGTARPDGLDPVGAGRGDN